MTDHSILCRGERDLPFEREARLITRFVTFVGTTAPRAMGAAIRARNLYEDLYDLDDDRLSALGVERSGIAAYAAKRAGLLDL